jgi:hypothetical protein
MHDESSQAVLKLSRAIVSQRFPLGDESVCHRGHSRVSVTLI